MRFNAKAATFGLSVILVAASATFDAQAKLPYEEYDKLIANSRSVTTLGPEMFGDSVDLATGALSFSITDVSLPGNNQLPVAVTRKFRVNGESSYTMGAFSDWDLDIPNISGLFIPTQENNFEPVWHDDRCDKAVPGWGYAPGGPNSVIPLNPLDYWKNNTVQMPGGGELLRIDASTPAEILPNDGVTYRWITPARTVFRCLGTKTSPSGSAVENYKGQAFFAVTADGTKYRFDHMAVADASSYEESVISGPNNETATGGSMRLKNALYATYIEDRFGNWVKYSYNNAYNSNLRVNSITSSDGRSITFQYDNYGRIQTATAGGRTWTYNYTGFYLTSVVLPDGNRWSLDLQWLSQAEVRYFGTNDDTGAWRSCRRLGEVDLTAYPGTITHPSGAVGKFTVQAEVHARSNVPMICRNYVPSPGYNAPADDLAVIPFHWHSMTLKTKEISGPGLPTQTWAFSYTPGSGGTVYPDGGTEPICKTDTCLEPYCLSDDCAWSSTTTVVGPSADWKRYTFGTSYHYNEGKLLKIEVGSDETHILSTTTKTYELATSGKPYTVRLGTSQQPYGDGFVAEYARPEVTNVISQQNVDFTRAVQTGCVTTGAYCLDKFLRPTKVKRSSTAANSITETTTYFDQIAKWVLGQVSTTKVGTKLVSQTDYDATTALPLKTYSFGLLQQTFVYNPDGTVKSVADGGGKTTAVSDWYRGVPRTITYADTKAESATVSGSGHLLSTTDELGYATSYSYDPMDRLTGVTYPIGDTVTWAGTTLPFVAVATVEYGIPGGHWKQTVKTGTGQTTTFYDAQWRPVLALTQDTAIASSKSFVVNRYDAGGRVVFSSYPVASLTSVNDTLQGISTQYDALGRVIKVMQDSELGVLTTTTAYLNGFKTSTTNPRNFTTTTSYQAFDTPDTSRPTRIDAPEGVLTVINRDDFGKPLKVTRTGPKN